MKVLDLFSGIGGFSLGLERAGMETIAFCEFDKKAQLVLKKHWPDIPIYDDIRELTWKKFVQDAKKQKLKAAEECKHTANHVTHNNSENGERKTGNGPEKTQETGQKRKKMKSSNSTEGGVFVAEKPQENFSPLTTSSTTETQSEGNISHKHGSSSLNEDSPMTTKSFATTATTQEQTMDHAHTEEFRVDVITAGVPCQPASQAGKRGGESDNRWLWPEALRVISEFHPRWAILENVYGFLTLDNGMAFDKVCVALEAEGYSIQTFIIPACAVNAPHRRERYWIIGRKGDVENSSGTRTGVTLGTISDQGRGTGEGRAESIRQGHGEAGTNRTATTSQDVAHTDSDSKRPRKKSRQPKRDTTGECSGDSSKILAHAKGGKSGVKKTGDGRESPVGGSKEESSNVAYPVSSPKGTAHRKRTSRIADKKQNNGNQFRNDSGNSGETLAHTKGGNRDGHENVPRDESPETQEIFGNGSGPGRFDSWWAVEPNVGRVAHGVPNRVDRLKQLGNAVIPQIPELIGRAIMAVEAQPCK